MVQMDFLAANHVCIVGLCGHAHRAVIFAIAQLSCLLFVSSVVDLLGILEIQTLRSCATKIE